MTKATIKLSILRQSLSLNKFWSDLGLVHRDDRSSSQ